jgi:hypothetical protein
MVYSTLKYIKNAAPLYKRAAFFVYFKEIFIRLQRIL